MAPSDKKRENTAHNIIIILIVCIISTPGNTMKRAMRRFRVFRGFFVVLLHLSLNFPSKISLYMLNWFRSHMLSARVKGAEQFGVAVWSVYKYINLSRIHIKCALL